MYTQNEYGGVFPNMLYQVVGEEEDLGKVKKMKKEKKRKK